MFLIYKDSDNIPKISRVESFRDEHGDEYFRGSIEEIIKFLSEYYYMEDIEIINFIKNGDL